MSPLSEVSVDVAARVMMAVTVVRAGVAVERAPDPWASVPNPITRAAASLLSNEST